MSWIKEKWVNILAAFLLIGMPVALLNSVYTIDWQENLFIILIFSISSSLLIMEE
jgi:hypothetical protein